MSGLTINDLRLKASEYRKEVKSKKDCEVTLRLAAIALLTMALITMLQPLLKGAFSGVIQYSTPTIALASATGGCGLLVLLISFQRRCSANQVPLDEVVKTNLPLAEQVEVLYNTSFTLKDSFTLSIQPDLRREGIQRMDRVEYKNFVFRVYRDYYDVQLETCRDRVLIEDLRAHSECQSVVREISAILPAPFVALLSQG